MAQAKKREAPFSADQYTYTIAWSEEDKAFIGRVLEFRLLGADGPTPEQALKEIRHVLDIVLQDIAEQGDTCPEPLTAREYSGRFNVRLPKDLHRELVTEALRQGVSLNDWVNRKLAR